MNKSIVVLGSSNTDMVVELDRLPAGGETLLGRRFFTAHGGKGANQAVAAARAGGRVHFICKVGRDSLGDAALRQFRSAGIDTHAIMRTSGAPSGAALIFVGRKGENAIGVAPGANALLSPADVLKHRNLIRNAAVLLLQLETPVTTVAKAAALADQAGVRVILNPAPARKLPASLFKHVSILTPNESEAAILTGLTVKRPADAEKAADRLLNRGVQIVIITLGAGGALIADRETRIHVPGFKVKAVDTVAAGDTFNGALAVALSEGKGMAEAVRFANAAAALSVTQRGAQESIPLRGAIDRFLRTA